MRRLTPHFVLSLLLALLQACVSVGNPSAVDERAVSQLRPLRDRTQDVARTLGAPTHPEAPASRLRATETVVEVWTYDYTHVHISPLTLVPLFGPFLGSSPVTSGSAVVRFDADGVVQAVNTAPHFDPRSAHEGFDFQLPLY